MKIFSTFSGIGGFEIGIQSAVESNRKTQQANANSEHSANDKGDPLQERRQSATCVGYSEIDKYAASVYEYHFKGAKNYGDITKINAEELPDFDCLVGGFPCQAFSIAGKRGGFTDTRGTLFFDLARILKQKQPRLFVFENVKGLLSHEKGRTFRTILTTIDELGYDCQWQVLNSKNHRVPQNRERIIIVGHLRGTPRPEVFPITGSSQQIASVAGYISEEVWPRRHEQIRRTYNTDGAMPTIPTGQGGGVMTKIYQKPNIRRLTPLECERLQAFPDNWTAKGINGDISDTQRYKMCGNAVTTNVIQAVFERIFETNLNKRVGK